MWRISWSAKRRRWTGGRWLNFLGKRVLVTGAGRAIDGGVWRVQILTYGPEQLVLVERSENALYEIEREIRKLGVKRRLAALLRESRRKGADGRDLRQVQTAGCCSRGGAQAYCALMEQNPSEALKKQTCWRRGR